MPKKSYKYFTYMFLVLMAFLFISPVDMVSASSKIGVTVDGKNVSFDVAPFVNAQDRTMVPIRFVAEELGAQVDWIPAEQKVLMQKNGQEIELWIGKRDARIGGTTVTMDTQAELRNARTMVPLRFISESFGASVEWQPSNSMIVIKTVNQSPSIVVQPEQILPSGGQALIDASILNVRKGPSTSYEIITKVNRGDAVDLIGLSSDWYYIKTGNGTEGWVIKDYLVMNTDRDDRDDLPSRGDNPSELSSLINVEYEAYNDAFYLTLKGDSNLYYNTTFLDNPRRLVIDLKGVTMDSLDKQLEDISTNNSLVSKIRVGQFSDNTTRVVLELSSSIDLKGLNKQGEEKITFELKTRSIAGKLIVIDPGHGSINNGVSDPGAVGPSKLYERDVVVDIANRLAAILKTMGAEVVLTRTEQSTHLGLDGRVELANSMNADLFVSIHANANTNSSANGTSTYFYAPKSNPTLAKQRDERVRLATLVQQEVVASAGRRNIGILESSFKVIRETNMPSILVETAFISNPTEEKLLATPSFREDLAKGIAAGLKKYYN